MITNDVEQTPPVFQGVTYDDHVRAWRVAAAATTYHQFQLGASACSPRRSVGGSPRRHVKRQRTVVQKFCDEVGIDRQTFQRLSRTYKTFAETGTTGGTRFISALSFKHFEVAARLATDPVAAVADAYEKRWSANELQRQLAPRPDPSPLSIPFSILDAQAKLQQAIEQVITAQIASWPEGAQAETPRVLEAVFRGVLDNASNLRPLTPAERHALRWIKTEMECFPFVRHTFNEIQVGRGGSCEVVGGAAGARIYHEIVGTTSCATRQDVLIAVNNLLTGKVTALGRRVLDVARDLAARRLWGLMKLPPEAGALDDLPPCLSELITPDDAEDPIAAREAEALMPMIAANRLRQPCVKESA